MRLAQWKCNLKGLGHSRLHILSLAVTWLMCADYLFSGLEYCLCKVIEHRQSIYHWSFWSSLFLSCTCRKPALKQSRHLFPTCRHCLTLEPHVCVKFLIMIALPLFNLNVSWLSSAFCSGIIVIFIHLFMLSFHKRSALTTERSYFWSVTTVFVQKTADHRTLFWTLVTRYVKGILYK